MSFENMIYAEECQQSLSSAMKLQSFDHSQNESAEGQRLDWYFYRMVIVIAIRMNNVGINPHGLWELGVKISHMLYINQGKNYNKEPSK
jgi:hypothetical protein